MHLLFYSCLVSVKFKLFHLSRPFYLTDFNQRFKSRSFILALLYHWFFRSIYVLKILKILPRKTKPQLFADDYREGNICTPDKTKTEKRETF